MSCCVGGSIHNGNTTGEERELYGLNVYVSSPANNVTPKAVIVFIPDAFGWKFINNRLLADKYAKKGQFLVLLPDFMNGSAMDSSVIPVLNKFEAPAGILNTLLVKPILGLQIVFNAIPFALQNRRSIAHPRIVNFVSKLRTQEPAFETNDLKICVAGFCWGGTHAILLAHDNPAHEVGRHESQTTTGCPMPLVDCAFAAHPSLLSVPNDINDVGIPLSVAVGNNDSQLSKKNMLEMKEILEKMKGDENEVNIIPGAKHGFALRLNLDNPNEVQNAEMAEKQAINFFTKCSS